MMENLQIDTGVKRLMINGDESRVLEFNPEDIVFAEKFYQLNKNFEQKAEELELTAERLEREATLDENGVPSNLKEQIQMTVDLCNYLREQIDLVFGTGTSQMLFGETQNMNMFEQFFNGIVPYIKQARSKKVAQYRKKD